MRYMLIVYPKIYETAEAGWLPDLDDKGAPDFAEELHKAGVLVTLTGLTPPATMSARLDLGKRKGESHRRPVPRSQGSGRRRLDYRREVARRSAQMGFAHPGPGQ